jgi:(p)ppGpp synthase/HD superfamily hydrolase
MSGIVKISAAACFAAQKHAGQKRKGARGEPYVNHLAEVAALLAESTAGEDADLVAAAWLHDCIEDQGVAQADLAERFGAAVASIVWEVTDDKSLPEAERKRKQVETVASKSRQARLLKLADKTSNVTGVVESPPADWSPECLAEYVSWAVEVVDAGCRGLNAPLESRFDAIVRRARRHFAKH